MKRTLAFTAAAALFGMLAFSGSAFAYRPGCDAPPCGGGGGNDPGGGGGGPGEETAAQNLSVPTIMVGTPPGGLYCGAVNLVPTELAPPPGPADLDPLYYEVPDQSYVDWWVQKVHTWQAQCFLASEASVDGAWGDNLGGDAKLKVGAPIRVEMVLNNATDFAAEESELPATLQGYEVIKLEPEKLDRESAYGHPAFATGDVWGAFPIDFPQLTTVDVVGEEEEVDQGWLVHDSQIHFRVCQLDVENNETEVCPVPDDSVPTAEINATGKVVYGYNLRVNAAGTYRITFTTSQNVLFHGVDDGDTDYEHDAWIDIDVVPGGGGGGGNPHK
jgi:hypothetical protein